MKSCISLIKYVCENHTIFQSIVGLMSCKYWFNIPSPICIEALKNVNVFKSVYVLLKLDSNIV